MDALYSGANIGHGASLCIAPLTKWKMTSTGREPSEAAGYFLYEQRIGDRDGVQILARVGSEEAAFRLAALLQLE